MTTVILNANEIRDAAKFVEEHCVCATGHPTRFIIETEPTGIGSVNSVTCLECRATQDITDYECW